ncbi:MAG: bifunctional glycosyltransferase/CDP-glycerol:glycerophosphate glycerophosphotransferase [Propionibacteriaceae bacterium]
MVRTPARESSRSDDAVAFARRGARGVYRRARRAGVVGVTLATRVVRPPLVSIIVPVYNVEAYLAECLTSLVTQNFRDLEIVVIDDGATDGSAAIARRMQLRHPHKIRYFRQENAGLGAARNAGVARARGRYLMFVDSDDTLPRTAVRTMVSTIERTGSDFVCGALQRVKDGVKWPPRWVEEVHRAADLKTTVWDRPDIVANAVSTNKLFNRDFWIRAELEFPVGVYYEDQIPSMKAYLAATSFDILPDVLYYWRIRTGDLSISQTTADLKNLRDRAYVTGEVNKLLLADGTPELRQYWLDSRVLTNDLGLYVKDVDWVSDEYYAELQRWIGGIFSDADWLLDFRASAMKRLLAWSLCHGDRSLVEELRAYERANGGGAPHQVVDGHLGVLLPESAQARLTETPPGLFRVEPAEIRLSSSLRNLSWTGAKLHLGGWAYLSLVDLAKCPTEITLELRAADGEAVLLAQSTEPDLDYRVTRRGSNRWADYDASGFRTTLDLAPLLAEDPERLQDAQLWVRVRSDDIEQVRPIMSAVANGGVKWPTGSRLMGDLRLIPTWRERILRLQVEQASVVVEDLAADGRDLLLECRSAEPLEKVLLAKTGKSGRQQLNAQIESIGDGRSRVRLKGAQDFLTEGKARKLRAYAPGRSMLTLADEMGDVIILGGVAATRSPSGKLVLDRARPRVVVETDSIEASRWRLAGRAFGADPAELRLVGNRHKVAPDVVSIDEDGRFEVEFPLEAAEWGTEARQLPPGQYRVLGLETEESERIRVTWSQPALARIPREFVDGRYCLRSTTNQVPIVEVLPDIGGDGTGAYYQRTLQEQVYQPARREARQEAVLFESFHGRNVTCNPAAIWQELENRGSALTMYWSVNDSSVWVPPGTTPLVRLSEEWYRVLGRAKYLVNNSNFPAFFEQAEDQVYLQTWHGTPLKKIGHDLGRVLFSYRNYLEMMDAEAANWNALISPNRFSTDLFPHAFAYSGEMLETGYPRNDQLVNAPEDAAHRARRMLGLEGDSRKVLLYAPTWRDDQFQGKPGRYQAVYHLDFDEFVAGLGSEYLILVRGHSNTLLHGKGVSADSVMDVTRYPEVAELYALADVLVTDYSSVMFDYSVTGKPLLFLAPDIADYRDRVRGFYFDFEATSPGPIVASTDELVTSLKDLDRVSDEYALRYKEFRRRFNGLEDGQASARVVDACFVNVAAGSRPTGGV